MKKKTLFFPLSAFLALSTLAFHATAAPPAEGSGPETATVVIDCARGDSIMQALEKPGVELTIEIVGICEQDVEIHRNRVNLVGADPALDGIRPDPNGFLQNALVIVDSNRINIQNLSFGGARIAVGINGSFGITFTNSVISDFEFAGIIFGTASGANNLNDVQIDGAPHDPRYGVWITNGGNARCTPCSTENVRYGFRLDEASQLEISGATITGTRRGVDMAGGSRLISWEHLPWGVASTLQGNSQAAIAVGWNSSAELAGDTINGRFRVDAKSVLRLNGTNQNNGASNVLTGGSTVIAEGSSSLQGDANINEFSTMVLESGSAISGALQCSTGGDAHCGNIGDTGGSNCSQCQ